MTTYFRPKAAGTPTWLDLMTPDVAAARAFYAAVLGWTYTDSGPDYGGYVMAAVNDHAVAGMMGPQPGAPPMPAAWSVYFATDDIEADVARAVDQGASVMFPPMAVGAFGSMAVCQDPTGASFSFWQAGQHVGSQVGEELGAAAWYELFAPNAKQASVFYAALLGATVDTMPGGMEYYVLKHGEQEIGGIMQIDPAWGDLPAQWTTYFLVDNTDAAAATIVQHGGTVMGIDDSPFGRMAAAADPSGATFKIIQPMER